jgi:hypothetical protein
VGFAEGGDGEERAEGIAGHDGIRAKIGGNRDSTSLGGRRAPRRAALPRPAYFQSPRSARPAPAGPPG